MISRTNGRPRCRGRHGGIGMTMQMSVNGTWWVRPRMASSKPRVIPPGTSQVNADFRGHARAPANQSQTSSGSGPVEASGIYTRETTGTITSIGVKAAHHLHASPSSGPDGLFPRRMGLMEAEWPLICMGGARFTNEDFRQLADLGKRLPRNQCQRHGRLLRAALQTTTSKIIRKGGGTLRCGQGLGN